MAGVNPFFSQDSELRSQSSAVTQAPDGIAFARPPLPDAGTHTWALQLVMRNCCAEGCLRKQVVAEVRSGGMGPLAYYMRLTIPIHSS